MLSILRGVCAEYTDPKLKMIAVLMKHQPTNEQLSAVGIDRINDHTSFDGSVNYVAVYEFADKANVLRVCDKMQYCMGARTSTVGALRAKVVRHDWEGKGQLRLGMSGEGTLASARKYRWLVENPPGVKRAKEGRQTNGGASSDGYFFNLPAAATLVGERCLRTIKVETSVLWTGDQNRALRETHEAIIALGVMGGLAFDRAPFSLNQKVGGSFTDEQRRKGVGETPNRGEKSGQEEEARGRRQRRDGGAHAGPVGEAPKRGGKSGQEEEAIGRRQRREERPHGEGVGGPRNTRPHSPKEEEARRRRQRR